jgi:WD40 repeat protein
MSTKVIRFFVLSFVVAALAFSSSLSASKAAPAPHELSSISAAPKIGDKQVKSVIFAPDDGYAILIGSNGYSTSNVAKTFNAKLKELNTDDETITSVAFSKDGGWVITYGTNGYWLENVPQKLEDKLKELNDDKSEIISVAIDAEDNWIVLYDEYGYSSIGMSKELVTSLTKVNKDKKTMKQVAFDPDGLSVLLYGTNGYYFSKDLPEEALKTLSDYNDKNYELLSVAFGPDASWVIVADKKIAWAGVSEKLEDKIKELADASTK